MEQIIPIILGVSLANERLIEILKIQFPWFANESDLYGKHKNAKSEMTRSIIIQLITILTGWITASLIASNIEGWNILNRLLFGEIEDIPVFIIGVLASAGSAFWNQVFSYTKAIKDIKKQNVTTENKKAEMEDRRKRYQSAFSELNTSHPQF